MPITFEKSLDEIAFRVQLFKKNRAKYMASDYKEAHTRQDLIDPFFAALGWDVHNLQGAAPDAREVIFEDTVEIAGQKKAPDYSFWMKDKRKFFAEAKKPGVYLKDDPSPAYQLRRYAWTAKLPLSLLTDFEELAIYDCRKRPNVKDKASAGRFKYLTYEAYADQWREIWDIFSHEAVSQGSFDQYAIINKKGTSEVDSEFLKEIEGWRDSLARNIATRNTKLTIDELNDAVQRIIDRIIFLRIAEDKGVEEEGRLRRLTEGQDIYAGLLRLSKQADAKYNSGLFDFGKQGDTVTPRLNIDDKTLRPILANLYFPHSPYEFSVLPVEILGNVYEQFLGKVIRLTSGHQAKVEEKPEVKKAGGVYYTPAYIVEYIVQNTVGKLTQGKNPKQLKGFRVLDPACGSGSFLLGAYQYLLAYYLSWYTANDPAKWTTGKAAPLYQAPGSEPPAWRLTTGEKKRILTEHIYGVDIDRQAVEVTKLSLLLKVLENESGESLTNQLTLIDDETKERVLPNLDKNIKCGNSLIGPDYFTGQLIADPDELKQMNAFDWAKEFPEAMGAGGFNAVVGNPPYLGGREWKEEGGRRYDYFVNKFFVAEYQFDMYALFWEQGIYLLQPNGLIGLITPNTWLNNQSNTKLRTFIMDNTSIASITDYSRVRVFPNAVVLPIVSILKKDTSSSNLVEIYIPEKSGINLLHRIPQSLWASDEQKILNINLREGDAEIRAKIESDNAPLESMAEVKFGIKLYETGKGKPPQKATDAKEHVFEASQKLNSNYRPYLEGKDINRYKIIWQNRWLKYGDNLAAPRDPALFEGQRLLIRRIVGARLIGTWIDSDYVTSQLLQIVKPNEPEQAKYLLGILNSSLIAFYFKKKYNRQDKTFPEIRIYELASLPIHSIDFSKPTDKARHDRMITLVDSMLDLNKRHETAKDDRERELYQRQIDATDQQIDALVYELYGLTAEEIKVVEGS